VIIFLAALPSVGVQLVSVFCCSVEYNKLVYKICWC